METSTCDPAETASVSTCEPGPFNKLGDTEILHVLEFCFVSRNQHHLRLVNKRLARLALPLTLRTLAICSPQVLERLIHSSNGPLFNEDLSKHVLCLEICFAPHDFVINSEDLPRMCPNLIVVRFRFDLGVDATKLPGGDVFQRIITHDSIFAEKRQKSHQTWLQFLSKFNPKKFEWVASDNRTLRLVGVHHHLRRLFASWQELELVFLDGICLLEDNKKQWRVWLPTNTVAIRGPFYDAILSFLYKVSRIQPSPACHLLMLESCVNAFEMQQQFAHGVPAVSLLENTLVTTIGWTYSERELLVSGLTRFRPRSSCSFFHKPPARPASPNTDYGQPRCKKISLRMPFELISAIFLVLVCLFCHVFMASKVASVKTDLVRAYPAARLDKFKFSRTPRVADFFKASKRPAGFTQGNRLPTHIVPAPTGGTTDPITIPSCWCSCDQSGPSFPNMKKIVYT